MASTSSQDAWYLALLGLAEHFRVSTPPNIRMCVQCLQTVFSFKPPPRVEARTHLQLGNILVLYTKNIDLARSHLEQAVSNNNTQDCNIVMQCLNFFTVVSVTEHCCF